MKMTILHRDDDITHVVLIGRLDSTGTEDIRAEFSQATAARERPAIVDLSEVAFMASRGIGLLVVNGKKLLKGGHRMVLLNPQEIVKSVLVTSGLGNILPIAHDLDEAIQILEGARGPSDTATSPPTNLEKESHSQRLEIESAAPSVIEGELKLAIKNEHSELEGLNTTLAQFLEAHGIVDRAAYAVNLAIDELVVNVIHYAYVDDDTHMIDIELAIDAEEIILRIEDDGRPFDPRRGPSLDLHAEDREVGGLGLLLVLDMVDVLKYRRVEERNCVEVRIHLASQLKQGDSSSGEQSNVPEAG